MMKWVVVALVITLAGSAYALGERTWGKAGAVCVWGVECGDAAGGAPTPSGAMNWGDNWGGDWQ